MTTAMFKTDLLEALGAHFSSYTIINLFLPTIDRVIRKKEDEGPLTLDEMSLEFLYWANKFYEADGEFLDAFPRVKHLIATIIQVHYQKY